MPKTRKPDPATISLKDATLSQFSDALIRGNGFGSDAVWVKDFFQGANYSVIEESCGQYSHNCAQFVMKDFFEKEKGFTKVKETFYDESGEMAVTFENLEIEKDQFIKVYKNAFVMYEKTVDKTTTRICLSINKYSAREITYRLFSTSDENILSEWLKFAREHNMYRGKKITAECSFLKIADVKWEDIILPTEIIGMVRQHVDELFFYSEYLKANNMNLKRGVILAGDPGTGKTMLCKVMAREINGTVIYALPSNLGRSEDIARVCEMAKDLAPCILIIEDIDWLAEDREQSYSAGAVIELMNYLDGVQEFTDVVTLATTNNHEKIEKAVANRPGRFDRVIQIPKPNVDCRLRMLKKFTEKLKFDGSIDWSKVVQKSDGLSGSHMKEIAKTVVLHAIRDKSTDENKIAIIKQKHFDSTLAEVSNEQVSSFNKAANKKRKIGFGVGDDD